MENNLEVKWKSGSGEWLGVCKHPRTGAQVAVVRFDGTSYKLSVPVEGMSGWSITFKSQRAAEQAAKREASIVGKIWNRVAGLPCAFFRGTLS